MFTGVVVYGAALGGLFAIAFAVVHGRAGAMTPRGTAAWLAFAGFATLYLVPWLKYPANPPSVGSPDTIGYRTELYFTMVLVSALAAMLAAALARMSVGRVGRENGRLVGLAVFICVVGLWGVYLPAIDEVPPEFSATLLWNFRLASLGIQAVLWAALGITFGLLAERHPLGAQDRHGAAERPAFR